MHWRRKWQPTPVFLPGESPRDGGAWWAAIYGVTQSWARLKWLSSRLSKPKEAGVRRLRTLIKDEASLQASCCLTHQSVLFSGQRTVILRCAKKFKPIFLNWQSTEEYVWGTNFSSQTLPWYDKRRILNGISRVPLDRHGAIIWTTYGIVKSFKKETVKWILVTYLI